MGKALITAATNNEASISNNSSSGFSAGVNVSLGTRGVGLSATASGNTSQGKASGSSAENVFSHISGGKRVILDVSDDLDVLGGVISGDRVLAKIGGDLRITTPQDRSDYTSQQSSFSAGVSIPLYGYALPSASLDVSTSSGSSHMLSAGAEQAGIRAGSGGFNIVVDKDTTLTGAVISSLADESYNRLMTRDLFVSDLQNVSSASASTTGFSMSSSFFTQGMYGALQGVSKNLLGLAGDSESETGSTLSAVSPGTILLTGLSESAAQEKIAALNRDAFSSNTPVTGINVQDMMDQQALSQKMKAELFQQGSIVLDSAYNKITQQHQVAYVRTLNEGADPKDPNSYTVREATQEEISKAKNDKYCINGLLTSIPGAINQSIGAGYDKGESMILLYDKPATNILGDLLAGGYEISLGSTLGWSNYATDTDSFIRARKGLATLIIAHSDGTSVLNSVAQMESSVGYNNRTIDVTALSSPLSESEFRANLSGIANKIEYKYNPNDFVAVVIGGNPGNSWKALLDLFSGAQAHSPYNAYSQKY